MDCDAGEAAFSQQLVQLNGPSNALHEDDNLIKVERIKQVV